MVVILSDYSSADDRYFDSKEGDQMTEFELGLIIALQTLIGSLPAILIFTSDLWLPAIKKRFPKR